MYVATHAQLMAGHRPTGDEAEIFDAHVLACILANARDEAASGEASLEAATGLDRATLEALLDHWFPFADTDDYLAATPAEASLADEEEMLRDLLLAHRRRGEGAAVGVCSPPEVGGATTSPAPDLASVLAAVVARRAMKPDHLWQDLGLFDRAELGRLLARHFPTLHAGNTTNMRWKKYFYRKLCEAEGFVLCTAPSCAQCTDFAACFGAEDGESRMAKTRREIDRGAMVMAAE